MTGMGYDTANDEGAKLWLDLTQRATGHPFLVREMSNPDKRYHEGPAKMRVGQGGFRVLVTDAYQRRCAMTGERTLPALEAAHIKPYGSDGPHSLENGLLLRADLHKLFDEGYMTVTENLRVEVSPEIRERFHNGRDYYALHGKPLAVLPGQIFDRPSEEYLRWHNENVFLAR